MATGDGGSRVVLVTGASSGIGRETALAYAARGARIAIAARSEDKLKEVAEDCFAAGALDVVTHRTDIAEVDDVRGLFEEATRQFGRIDVVVQCAAITAFGRFEDVPVDVFDGIIKTNLLGSANVARSALAHFTERGQGHLVLIGSLLGVVAVPYQPAYVVSKHGLQGLVRVLRQETRDQPGIRVHGVYPGPVDTPVYGTASNYYGREPRTPPTAVKPQTVVDAILRATQRRRSSERQVGWQNRPVILGYRLAPTLFDALIGPFVRAVSFTSTPSEDSSGNAFAGPRGG